VTEAARTLLEIPKETIAVLSVGELCFRKNHSEILKAMTKIDNPNVHVYIAGTGALEQELNEQIHELGLIDRVTLLGYRTDISELCSAADVFVLPSFQEGLPVALMEAIASRTPVLCSRIRGSMDLLIDDKYAFSPYDPDELAKIINNLGNTRKEIYEKCSATVDKNYINLNKYKKSNVNKIMIDVYESL